MNLTAAKPNDLAVKRAVRDSEIKILNEKIFDRLKVCNLEQRVSESPRSNPWRAVRQTFRPVRIRGQFKGMPGGTSKSKRLGYSRVRIRQFAEGNVSVFQPAFKQAE